MQNATILAPDRPAPGGAPPDILTLKHVSKRFPGVLALDRVSFSLRRGEAHALCGENGAGKSTLMKVMSGVYRADEGEVVYKGQCCNFASSVDAEAAGIAIIHQELNLVPHLSVAENIFLAREPRWGPFVQRARLRADAQALLERLGLRIDPDQLVKTLSCAEQQMVEIAKALSLNTEVLIMDEPTSSLTESETVRLFEIINGLKREGVSVVYISHRLDELQHIIDRVTVMRDGKFVCTDDFAATSLDAIVANMVGRTLDEKFPERTSQPQTEILLRVDALTRPGVFGPVSFDLRRGEILGFAGLMGAGRTEVARAIFGADPVASGAIFLGQDAVDIQSPVDAIALGIAYLSEDRKQHGLAIRMSVAANLTLTNMAAVSNRFGFIDFAREKAVAQRYIDALGIKTPSSKQVAKNLSGGNQQKIVISKWLFRDSKIIFFDEPTRGIDVGAKFAIYQLMDKLAADGIGVVLITSELPEIMGMTDRVAVFHGGKISGIVNTRETTQEHIMHLASGSGARSQT
ncbi:sugar ABC transporter ATP-binding protein [Massilia sp. S19_KUP03_FR1]|uniref:sugar ABC transporter ATP-binding protein n=1 Tax=Massilia sp. S19_KUP03_FR1 TaxID=3025503 RepID=UPI002FCDCDC2